MSDSVSQTENSSAFARRELAAVIQLASSLWLFEVDVEMLQIIRRPDVVEAFNETGFPIPDLAALHPESSDDAKLVDELAVEFCRLLVGPKGHVPPVESIWKTDRFEGQPAADTRRYFELLPGYHPPMKIADHIGSQLHFVAAVLNAESDGVEVAVIVERFARESMQWTDRFLEAVANRESRFYRWLADFTADLIQTLRNLNRGQ